MRGEVNVERNGFGVEMDEMEEERPRRNRVLASARGCVYSRSRSSGYGEWHACCSAKQRDSERREPHAYGRGSHAVQEYDYYRVAMTALNARKGQTSLEALVWLTITVFMAVAAAAAFAGGLPSVEGARANLELGNALDSLFSTMESVNEGSVRFVEVSIPSGVEAVNVSADGYGGSRVNLKFRGCNYTHAVPFSTVFASPNALGSPGMKLVRVEKRSGVVIISVAGG